MEPMDAPKTKIAALAMLFLLGALFAVPGFEDLPGMVPPELVEEAAQALEAGDYDSLLALWEEHAPEGLSKQPPTREEFEQMMEGAWLPPGLAEGTGVPPGITMLTVEGPGKGKGKGKGPSFETEWGFEWPPGKGKGKVSPPMPDVELPLFPEGWAPGMGKAQGAGKGGKKGGESPPEVPPAQPPAPPPPGQGGAPPGLTMVESAGGPPGPGGPKSSPGSLVERIGQGLPSPPSGEHPDPKAAREEAMELKNQLMEQLAGFVPGKGIQKD